MLSYAPLDDLQYSEAYAEFIMSNGDPSERIICNGDTLTEAMEDGYLFEDFLKFIGWGETRQ